MSTVQLINSGGMPRIDRSTSSRSELSMETFLKILTVQLSNQNPLEPMNDRDFFAQMAQLGTVQGLDNVKRTLDVGQAAALIGKTITAVRPMTDESSSGTNALVTGVAKRFVVRSGDRFLALQEPNGGIVEVRMANIREVSIQ